MQKIIAALDGLNLSESTLDYAVYIAKEFDAHIVGAFLEEMVYHYRPENPTEEYVFTDWSQVDTLVEKEKQIRKGSLRRLQSKFNFAGIKYNIHQDDLIAIQSLIKESRFADMILIDANERFSNWDKSRPSNFIRNLLADADCPVMLVPHHFKPIERFVFAYDGSPSSVYAIRQFSYLFPLTESQQVEIMMITDDKHSNHFPDHKLLKELLKRKYSIVLQTIVKSDETCDALVEYLKGENRNCMVILGAYQRSSFSRWLNASKADAVLAGLDIPVFIAHR